jgi:hypothetical protein
MVARIPLFVAFKIESAPEAPRTVVEQAKNRTHDPPLLRGLGWLLKLRQQPNN